MTFILEANMRLLSLNQAFATIQRGPRRGIRIKSKKYVIFKKAIKDILTARKKEFEDFNNSYNPFNDEIFCTLEIFTPDLFTKDGRISKNSLDCGNAEKVVMDSVLIGKIDDSQLTRILISKQLSEKHGFRLTLEIKKRLVSS